MPKYFITLLLLAALFAACKKDKLPQPTESGQNKMVCKINGQVHTYSGIVGWFHDEGVNASLITYLRRPEIWISARSRKTGGYDDIDLVAYTDGMELNKPTRILRTDSSTYESMYENNFGDYYYPYDNSSTITFTRFDNEVVAGHFEFHGRKGDTTIHITEGWFDIQVSK